MWNIIRLLDVEGIVDNEFIACYFNALVKIINHSAQNDLTIKTIEYPISKKKA